MPPVVWAEELVQIRFGEGETLRTRGEADEEEGGGVSERGVCCRERRGRCEARAAANLERKLTSWGSPVSSFTHAGKAAPKSKGTHGVPTGSVGNAPALYTAHRRAWIAALGVARTVRSAQPELSAVGAKTPPTFGPSATTNVFGSTGKWATIGFAMYCVIELLPSTGTCGVHSFILPVGSAFPGM